MKGGNRQITVTNSATTLTIGGVIQNDNGGARGLTKAGAGTLRLSGTSSTYTGVTTITAGTLSVAAIGNGGAVGSLGQATNAAGNIVFNGGTLLYTGANATSDRAFTINTGITATIETTNNLSLAGATGAATNGALTKTGAGALTLTGVNTYSGLTTVSAGILAITGTGSINTTSAINVAAGGTLHYNSSTALTVAPTLAGAGTTSRAVLGGTGTINVAVTLDNLGDVLSPGNSPGIQNYTVDQTWSSFSYDWEVNNFTGTTAGTDFDQITGTAFTLGGGPGSYILNVIGLDAGNVAGLTPNFSEIDRTWTILTSSGTSSFNAANWTINTAGFSSPDAGTWTLGQAGNNLVLSYTVIPEPSTALLCSLGLLALLRRRRN